MSDFNQARPYAFDQSDLMRQAVLTEEQQRQQAMAMQNWTLPRGGEIPFVYPAYARREVMAGEMVYAEDLRTEKPCKCRVIEPPQLTDR